MGVPALELLFRRYAEMQDESAARELVARTRPKLLAIARSIGNAADAEDSVQTAYLSLLHKREDFDAPVLAWLVTATVRIAYRAKAKRQRLTELAEALVRPPAPESPASLAGDAEERRVLRQRVTDLPASLRDAAVLHYFHGLSTEETARLLDLSRDAVKKRLQRARTTLRSRWGPRLASLMFAFPWWCADTVVAAAGLAGGLIMKKAAVAGRAEGKGPFYWKLVDVDGVVRDERTTDANRIRLFTTVGGPHKLVVRHGETVSEHEVSAKLGGGVSAGRK